jgi:carboxypeptidase T
MIPITAALLAALFLQQGVVHPIDLCEVHVADAKAAERLFRLVRDYDDHSPIVDGKARIYSDSEEEARLVRAGWQVDVVQRDLARFYAERAAANPPPVMGGSMGGFKTLAEIVTEMDRLATTYPSIVSPKFSIGTTVGGRPIWCMRVSDNPTLDEPGEPIVWYDALHHAREPMGGEALLLFADWLCTNYPANPDAKRLVETRNMLFTPCVNPDGYEYNRSTNPNGGGLWRKNRRNNGDGTFGVDLNRNYGWNWGPQWNGSSSVTSDDTYRGPSAFSELETQAVRNFLLLHPPGFSFSAHTYSDLWLFPWGYATGAITQDDAKFRHYAIEFAANNGWV